MIKAIELKTIPPSSPLVTVVRSETEQSYCTSFKTMILIGGPYKKGKRGSPGLQVKFKLSLSPEANIVMYIHIQGDI